jgi:hypothetical protein
MSSKTYANCWQEGTPVASQQFAYVFDDIGHGKMTGWG